MESLTILITGATSGIGRAAALALVRDGHTVFAAGRRADRLAELAAEAGTDRLVALPLDVTDAAAIQAAVETVDRQTDGRGLDALVNNAGYAQYGPTLELTDEQLADQFAVNVFGLLAVTRAFAPAMIKRRAGRIVNVSSIVGRYVMPYAGAYGASKHTIEALSDALRMELRPFGVGVVLVEPGPIRTEFTQAAGDHLPTVAADSPFYAGMTAYRARLVKRQAKTGPEVVAAAIREAITAEKPRARRIAPSSARWMVWLLMLLPVGLRDRLLLRQVGGSS